MVFLGKIQNVFMVLESVLPDIVTHISKCSIISSSENYWNTGKLWYFLSYPMGLLSVEICRKLSWWFSEKVWMSFPPISLLLTRYYISVYCAVVLYSRWKEDNTVLYGGSETLPINKEMINHVWILFDDIQTVKRTVQNV